MTTFKPASELTQEYVREWLDYCPATGIFVWRKSFNRIRAGEIAGGVGPGGYVRITLHGHRIMAHILAWLWMMGEYVYRGIDHENAARDDNRWTNLRRASGSQNNMNQGLRSDNALGVKRVYRKKGKKSRPFAAAITVDRKQRHLGYFETVEAAAAAYREAAIREFGEYARFT
jgi:hypothetical protein